MFCDVIKCGKHHSYVHTQSGGHYLFGLNTSHECLVFDNNPAVSTPNFINDIIKEHCNIKSIVDVVPGCNNTKIICTL